MKSVPPRGSGWVSRLPNDDCRLPIGFYETVQSEIGAAHPLPQVVLTSLKLDKSAPLVWSGNGAISTMRVIIPRHNSQQFNQEDP